MRKSSRRIADNDDGCTILVSDIIKRAAFDNPFLPRAFFRFLKPLKIRNKLQQNVISDIPKELVGGTFELIYSSVVANLPVVGSWWGGYLPNRETIQFDLERGELRLCVETFDFLANIDIVGGNLTYDESSALLEYTVQGRSSASSWSILYAD